jgi:small subunit ribosomal protein S11
MSRLLAGRLATPLLHKPLAPTTQCRYTSSRLFSQTRLRQDEHDPTTAKPRSRALLENLYGSQITGTPTAEPNSMSSLSQSTVFKAMSKSGIDTSVLSGRSTQTPQAREDSDEPFHFHIMSHKHNTHVTCTRPNREPIISLSCGNIGFKKSRRGSYDAAYSLMKYTLERLIDNGWPMKMRRLEIVLRGYGQGREAAIKVLMSPEGRVLRDKIVRVADSTRIKFGGTRSPAQRRL